MADHEPPVRRIVVAKNRNGPTGSVKLAWLDLLHPFRNLGGRGRRPRARDGLSRSRRGTGVLIRWPKGPPSVIPARLAGRNTRAGWGTAPRVPARLRSSKVRFRSERPFREVGGAASPRPPAAKFRRRHSGMKWTPPRHHAARSASGNSTGFSAAGSCRDRRSWWRGEPGAGKSTLLLQLAAAASAEGDAPVLYVSGEESEHQLKRRGERLGLDPSSLALYSETDIPRIVDAARSLSPQLLVLDSVQCVHCPNITGAPRNGCPGAGVGGGAGSLCQSHRSSGVPRRSCEQGRGHRRPPHPRACSGHRAAFRGATRRQSASAAARGEEPLRRRR